MNGDGQLPRGAIEGETPRQPQDAGRERRPRIPVAKIEREQQAERRRLVGEGGDEIERREGGEETERGRDAEDDTDGHTPLGAHVGTIDLPRSAVKAEAIRHTVRPTRNHVQQL